MATFKAVVFSTKNHIKNDGTTNIKIRIYHDRNSQYISTDYFIPPKFMEKSGDISESYTEADILNYEISDIIQQYRKTVIQLGKIRASRMTCKDLKEYIEASQEPDYELIDFVKFSQGVIEKTKRKDTAEWYEHGISSLKWFFGKDIIDVRDITSSRLTQYIERLYEKGPSGKPLEPGSVRNYLGAIRSLFKKCLLLYNNEELDIVRIPHDPFKKIKIPKYKRKRKNITIEELKFIRDGEFETERENIGRDVLMIMFYLMGINVNDLFYLKPPVGGRIEYMRSKTDTDDYVYNFPLSIKVEPELQVLIDKYSPNGFLSEIKNRYSNSYNFMKSVNKGLKKIREENGQKKITTNWARHTWASLARNKAGISKADIDFCLGHVNNDYKMADIYIDIDYSIYDDVNRKVLDLIK